MLKDIVEVTVTAPYLLRLKFEDGLTGEVDIADITQFKGVFASLQDLQAFAQVSINTKLGTIQWPNGADLDPDVLYAHICGTTIQAAA